MKPTLLKTLSALLFNVVMAALVASAIGINPVIGAIAGAVLGFVPRPQMSLMAGLNKEIWIAEIMEKFYPDRSFLTEPKDMSSFVDYNTINLADAGADPEVLINNTVWPIPVSQRTDTPLALPLDTLDTTSTLVRNVEEIEAAYDKMQSVVAGHKNSLMDKASVLAAYNYAPSTDDTATPVVGTTGAADGGFKKISLDDILKLRQRFDMVDAPEDSRVLVLHPSHFVDLMAEDKDMFKSFIQGKPGFELFGFKTYSFSKTPVYNKSTGAKAALGAAAAPTTDTISSVAFLKTEVMKAIGTVEMFATLKDPANKGDIINFQMRFSALPLRSKGLGAIYSAAV